MSDPSDPLRLLAAAMPFDGLPFRFKTAETIEVDLPDGPVHVRPGAPVLDLDGKVMGRIDSAHVEGDALYVAMTIRPPIPLGKIEVSFVVPGS